MNMTSSYSAESGKLHELQVVSNIVVWNKTSAFDQPFTSCCVSASIKQLLNQTCVLQNASPNGNKNTSCSALMSCVLHRSLT